MIADFILVSETKERVEIAAERGFRGFRRLSEK